MQSDSTAYYKEDSELILRLWFKETINLSEISTNKETTNKETNNTKQVRNALLLLL